MVETYWKTGKHIHEHIIHCAYKNMRFVPREEMKDLLDRKSGELARKILSVSTGSTTLEMQEPPQNPSYGRNPKRFRRSRRHSAKCTDNPTDPSKSR